MKRLGEALVESGAIADAQLNAALVTQQRSRSRLGETLLSEGAVGPLPLYRALASSSELPYVNLLETPPAPSLLRAEQLQDYIAHRALPWRREGETLLIATSEPNAATLAWAERAFASPARLVVTSPYDIRHALMAQFASALDEESCLALDREQPRYSARLTFSPGQRKAWLLAPAWCGAAVLAPFHTLAWTALALQLIYASTMLFKLMVFAVGARAAKPPALKLPEEATLPVYTLLIPLYDEASSLPHLLSALARLDYPRARLDIKLLLERDDTATWRAAQALKPTWNIEILRLPPSVPRTKPKALNYGLHFARGEFVTIFDAEDEPDPLQLKKAVAAFRAAPGDVACLQARLDYYNADDNWLTRWFALEYGILFDRMLPGLQALNIPLPLGGTSNHIALARLKSLGAWDPFNVTEDADLGVRLAALGLKTAMLDSVTHEESPIHLWPWMRQRSRWVKGYMQTWLVAMRAPVALWRQLGTAGFFGVHYFVGLAPVVFLTAPFVWGITLLSWTNLALPFPAWFWRLANLNLLLHFGVHWAQAAYALRSLKGDAQGSWRFRLSAITYPFYWALHSVAAWRALWQLLVKPHFWEKTAHGVAKRRNLA